MRLGWLEELLPQAMVTPRSRIWWMLFFALFPLAYVGGVMLERSEEGPARMMGFEDRAGSLRAAAQFAATKGFAVVGWHQYVIVETRDNLLAYYADTKDPRLAAASVLAPAREIQVLFRSPDQSHEFRVYLSLAGRVTGYDFGKSTSRNRTISSDIGIVQVHTDTTQTADDDETSMKNAARPSDMEAEAIARKTMGDNATLSSLVQLGHADVSSNDDDPARREVVWDVGPSGLRGLTLHISVSVRDGQVVAQHIEGGVDKEHVLKKRKLPLTQEAIYGFFLTFGAFYAIWRYAKRTLQKEVSHVRTLVVSALFFGSYSVYAYSVYMDQIVARISGETLQKIILPTGVAVGVMFAIMSLLVGIGYGSGEGEVRESYPGKLTSLDALLAGRIFSQDVAESLLFGAATAGWLFVCQHAVGHYFRSDMSASRNDVLTYTFARLPWLTLLVGKQYDALLVAVAGLLLPASFLLRSGVKKKRRFVWLIVFALCAVMGDAARYQTTGTSLLAMLILASALLLPFFAFDLLAAIVSLSALAFVDQLARLSAVFPSWTRFALWLAGLGVATLAVAFYLALRGRRVREEDVRPLYAKNLAERMSLQAEVLAAREAQLRLLPQAVPELPGIQFAACCLPARQVGGDFYDFFRLDANRVGIFVAQGGDQGLASALCIALAKGVLMHASLQPQSPTHIVTELEASLRELLEGGSGNGISFAYGVMDIRRNLMSYARIGSSPKFLLYRRDSGLVNPAQLEREVSLPSRERNAPPLYQGSAHGQAGDLLIFYTEGVTSLRARRFGRGQFQWLDVLTRAMGRQEDGLQASLLTALARHQNHASDDLTAVVIRLEESKAQVEEGVA
jgi:serine phosphatase RsbU (regulator of sigma subunit)